MSWWTKFKISITGSDFWGLIGPALKDLAKLLPKEVIWAAMEWVRQADTQDGWTGQEKRVYVITRLKAIQKEQIGDAISDAAFDALISLIVTQLQKGVIQVSPNFPIPSPEQDPYYRPLSFDPMKRTGLLRAGDRVYFSPARSMWYVEKNGLGLVPRPAGYDFLLTVA